LRCELFNHNVRLPISYFETGTSAHVVSRITFNVEQVAGAVTNALKIVIREGVYVIFLLAYLLLVNWRLCLVFLAVAPFIAIVVQFASKRFRRISRRIQNSMGDVTHVTSEVVNANREMRIFGGEEYEKQRFHQASYYNTVQSLKMAMTGSVSTPLIQIFVGIALCFLVWMMLHPTVIAAMTPGQFVAFITAAGMMAKPVRQLSEVQATIQMGLAAAQDIFYQLDLDLEIDSGSDTLQAVTGAVSFRNVSFAYDKGPLVLKDISFDVQAGQTIALVGSSGGGKSTLVSLLPRFYNPTSGQITIDGVDTKKLQLSNLRSHIALVSQNVILFNDTVRRNIAYGQLQKSSDAQIQDAAKRAYAHIFIEQLEEGYDTIVGDNGVLLSGGQRQRIAISRALLKDAPILIFDEATSALDNESERVIQADLEKIMQGRTTFVIAHRLTTVEKADVILVLEEGQIVEKGTHQELLTLRGRYQYLHQMMSRESD